MGEKYYSVDNISKMLGIHPKTVRRYITEGKLRAVKVGKLYRVSGHDLSLFVEERGLGLKTDRDEENPPEKLAVSAVADISVRDSDEADRISSMLLAVMNSHDPLLHQSSLNVRQYEGGHQLRVMLWGSARFVVQMLESIEALSERTDL
jgi:excisionase family DNA binding protein